jgi:sugar (pentulose or hexulose) kinase
VPDVCRVAIREVERIEPRAAAAAFYAQAHKIYQSLYPALKPVYAQIAELPREQ